ncbi:MAG: amidohydrolase family protein [Candidatus Thermoplasmatota archaeon]|jgi:imidazolonepropionase|nr:amidohydrolase family protein [Candidatus Thermoplasmatota archaeon]
MLVENVNIASPFNKKFASGSSFDELEFLEHQDIRITNGLIESITPTSGGPKESRWVIPAFSDPHTHVVFCGTRENEIDLKKTLGYEGVLKSGGGIYRTIKATTECDEDILYQESRERVLSMMRNGTAVFESKTGYGGDAETEEKMLKVMERIEKDLKMRMKKTLLAHVIPKGMSEASYLRTFMEMTEEFRKRIDFVDVFVDEGAFSPPFAKEAIQHANSLGVPGRIHLNELRNLDGVKLFKGLDIRSYDHMIETREDEIDMIESTITVLPFTAISLRKGVSIFSKMKSRGKVLAMGSDISPNTYITSFPLAIALGRQLFPFTIENLINMSTINSSHSLSLSDKTGSIHPGKEANIIVLKDHFNRLGYTFGEDPIERVIVNGRDIRSTSETALRH